jgi:hypothetical protein
MEVSDLSRQASKKQATAGQDDCCIAEHPVKDITTRSFKECTILDGITKKDLAAITAKLLEKLRSQKTDP